MVLDESITFRTVIKCLEDQMSVITGRMSVDVGTAVAQLAEWAVH